MQRIDAIDPLALGRGHAAALLEDQQYIVDRAILERIGDIEAIAIGDIAVGIDHRDGAQCLDLAGVAVPHDLVGAQPVAVAQQLDIAGGGHDLTVGVIFQRIGGEADFLVIVGHRRVGRADRRLGLVQLGLGRQLRMGQRRREQAGRGSAGKQRLFERQGKHGNLQA